MATLRKLTQSVNKDVRTEKSHITIRDQFLLNWFTDNKSKCVMIDEHKIPVDIFSGEKTKVRIINMKNSIDLDIGNFSGCKDFYFVFAADKSLAKTSECHIIDFTTPTLCPDMKKLIGEICREFNIDNPKYIYAGGKKHVVADNIAVEYIDGNVVFPRSDVAEYIYLCKTKKKRMAFRNSAEAFEYVQDEGSVKRIKLV